MTQGQCDQEGRGPGTLTAAFPLMMLGVRVEHIPVGRPAAVGGGVFKACEAARDVGLALCLRSRLVLLCAFCLMVYCVGERESFSIGAECVH